MEEANDKVSSKVVNNFIDEDMSEQMDIVKVLQSRNNKLSKPDPINLSKTKSNDVIVSSHTETDFNWATIVNKITPANIVKTGMTIGTASVTTLLGAGLGTEIGFDIGVKAKISHFTPKRKNTVEPLSSTVFLTI